MLTPTQLSPLVHDMILMFCNICVCVWYVNVALLKGQWSRKTLWKMLKSSEHRKFRMFVLMCRQCRQIIFTFYGENAHRCMHARVCSAKAPESAKFYFQNVRTKVSNQILYMNKNAVNLRCKIEEEDEITRRRETAERKKTKIGKRTKINIHLCVKSDVVFALLLITVLCWPHKIEIQKKSTLRDSKKCQKSKNPSRISSTASLNLSTELFFLFFFHLFAYTLSECVYCVGALYLRVCIDYGALHRLMSSDRIDGRRDGSRHTKIIIKKQQRKSIPEPLCSILNGRARHAASSAAYTTHTTNTQIQSLIAFDLTCDMRLFVNPPERTISWQLVWFPEIQFQPKSRMRAFRSTKSNEQYYRGCASIAYLCLPNILRKWQ